VLSWATYTVSCRSLLPIQSLSRFLGISIGKGKARIPWATLKGAPNDFIEEKYLPKNIALDQYYHLVQDDVNAMLKHWTERQAAGEVPFQFKKEVKVARKNKRTQEENAVDADAESDGEPQGDRQSGGGSQGPWNGEFRGEGGSNNSNEPALPGQGLGNAAEDINRVGWFLKHSDRRH
jgi:hypothetical protein